ncbi:MAG TPA: hypothetical protein VIJ86_07645 [Acidimicrobiales bacterium]
MTDAEHENLETLPSDVSASSGDARSSLDERVGALRGSAAVGVGRSFWLYTGAIVLIIVAVVVVISFISASNDNARVDRMKSHGISVTVTVVDCTGNLGGSGSNGVGYTCRGNYQVNGVSYHEPIGSMTAFSPPGTTVSGVVDPAQHGTVVVSSAIRDSSTSNGVYLAPSALAAAFLLLALFYVRIGRRSRRRHDPTGVPLSRT